MTRQCQTSKAKRSTLAVRPRLPRRFLKTARNDGRVARQRHAESLSLFIKRKGDTPKAGFCHFERSEKSTQMDSSPTAQNDTAHGEPLFKSAQKPSLSKKGNAKSAPPFHQRKGNATPRACRFSQKQSFKTLAARVIHERNLNAKRFFARAKLPFSFYALFLWQAAQKAEQAPKSNQTSKKRNLHTKKG